MSLEDIYLDYEKTLIVQYRTKDNAKKTVRLLVNQSLCDGLPLELKRAFDLDTAQGAQLDILGRIVGVNRNVYGLELFRTFFEMAFYEDLTPTVGFGRYNDTPYSTDLFLRYNSNASYSMTDFEMSSVIKMKIIQNNSWSSTKDLVDALYLAFGTDITLTDNKDMTLEYDSVLLYKNVVLICEYLDFLPRPMGVGINVDISSYSSSSSSSSNCSSSSSCSSSCSSSSSCRSSSSSCRSSSSSSSCRSSSSSSSSCKSSSSSSCRSSSSSSSSCRSSSSSSSCRSSSSSSSSSSCRSSSSSSSSNCSSSSSSSCRSSSSSSSCRSSSSSSSSCKSSSSSSSCRSSSSSSCRSSSSCSSSSSIFAGNDSFTKLLLHMDGANNSTIFIDSSGSGHGITAANDARISTSVKQFGTGSLLCDGFQDRLSIDDSNDFNFGSGDFTIDFWIYPISLGTTQLIYSQHNASFNDYLRIGIFGYSTGDLFFACDDEGSTVVGFSTDGGILIADTWQHIALVRNSNTWYIFLNGVSQTLTLRSGSYSGAMPDISGQIAIGGRSDGSQSLNGYLDEFRISKGVARYTTNFAVPTIPYA